LGINLDAFRVVAGVVIAGMGFEMLYGGAPSKEQGQKIEEERQEEDSGLIMPLSIPLIAGSGAIVTTIASASDAIEPLVAALIGAVVVALAAFVAFQWLSGAIARLSPKATALIVRLGGLILATIGVQMLLGWTQELLRGLRALPPISGVVSRDKRNILDETCLDGGVVWNGCLFLCGTSCGICVRLGSRSGRSAAGWDGHHQR
jgi:hypothetical protein